MLDTANDRFRPRRSAEHPRARRRPGWFRVVGLLLLVAGAWLTALAWGPGRLSLTACALGTLAACAALFIIAGRLSPSLVVPRLAIVSYGIQGFWLTGICLLGLPTTALGMGSPIDMADYPVLATAPLLLIPLAATLAAAMLRIPALRRRPGMLEQLGEVSPPGLSTLLVVAGIAMVAFWPATLPDAGRIGYMVRVLNYGFIYMAFLAGLYGRGTPLAFWWGCLALSSAISLTAGSRFFVFVPLALFLAGRIVKAAPGRRSRLVMLSAVLMAGTILVSGLVSLARGRVGRSGFEHVTVGRGVEMARSWIDVLGEAPQLELATEGVGRMVTWTNQAVCVLTPHAIPYRGLDTLWPEVQASASLSEFSGTTREDVLDVGLYQAPANVYGFNVSATNAVEFPLLADGWSRSGPWTALTFGLVAVLLGGLAEILALRMRARWPTAALALFVIAGKLPLDIAGLPLLAAVRSLLLIGSFVVILSMVAVWLAPAVRPPRVEILRAPRPRGNQPA